MKKLLNFLTTNPDKIHLAIMPEAVSLASLFTKKDIGHIQAYEIDSLIEAIVFQNPNLNQINLKVVDWESVVDNQATSVYIRSDDYYDDVLVNFYVNLVPIQLVEDDNGNFIGMGEIRTRRIQDFAKLYCPRVENNNESLFKVSLENDYLKIHGFEVSETNKPLVATFDLKVGDDEQSQVMTLSFVLEKRFAISSVIHDNDLGHLTNHRDGTILQKIINLNPSLQKSFVTIKNHDHITHEIQILATNYYGFARFYYSYEEYSELGDLAYTIPNSTNRNLNFLRPEVQE